MAPQEGKLHERGGDAEEVQSAADAFDPPIRRRPLADVVISKVRQLADEARSGAPAPLVGVASLDKPAGARRGAGAASTSAET